jgi:hypothetical protein
MKIAFLLGSGFSIPAGVPGTSKITEQIISCNNIHRHSDGFYLQGPDSSSLGSRTDLYIPRIKGLIEIIKKEVQDYYLDENWADYEHIYYVLQQIHDCEWREHDNPAIQPLIDKIRPAVTRLLVRNKTDTEAVGLDLLNLTREALTYIKCRVRSLLYKNQWQTNYIDNNLGNVLQDSRLEVIDIFTLNHDEVLEQFLEGKGIIYADGFGSNINSVRYWKPETYRDKSRRVKLVKLHGSINWYKFPPGAGIPLDRDFWHTRNLEGDLQLPSLDIESTPLMLIGTFNKMLAYTHGIFADLYYLFRRRLQKVNHLVVCGYGFGDKGINNSIIEWFNSNKKNKVVVIDPNEEVLREHARFAAQRFLFPEIVEEQNRRFHSIVLGTPNIGELEGEPNQRRKWEIIQLPIEVVSWEMIKKHLRSDEDLVE